MGYNNNFNEQNWGPSETTDLVQDTSSFPAADFQYDDGSYVPLNNGTYTPDTQFSLGSTTGWDNLASNLDLTSQAFAGALAGDRTSLQTQMLGLDRVDAIRASDDSFIGSFAKGLDSVFKDIKGAYTGSSESTKGGIWSALAGAAAAYGNKGMKEAQIDYYKARTKNDNATTARENAAQENKIAQQGSAAAAWGNVKKPGMLKYQPVKVENIGGRIV